MFQINPFLGTNDILKEYKAHLSERTSHHFGYPYNLNFNHQKLGDFLRYSINNLGDPFNRSSYGVHSRQFEVQVVQYFAHLWKIDLKDYWGYVTSCGTEGNLYGILLGREQFPDGIIYASVETHYSIFKAARFYRMEVVGIPTQFSGEMNYDAFEKSLQKHLDKPAIVNVNIGTTVKGAIDNLDLIIEILKRNGFFDRDQVYIHCDGALFALVLPFLQQDFLQMNPVTSSASTSTTTTTMEVSFRKPISSMSVSGHKFLGCPMPCGIVITYKKYMQNILKNFEHLRTEDSTILGSRNGQASIAMWYSLRTKGQDDLAVDAQRCIENARYLMDLLKKEEISCFLNPLSNTVVLERPQDLQFIRKWQLACKDTICHVIVMQNVTREKLREFVDELKEERIRTDTVGKVCIYPSVGDACVCLECKKNKEGEGVTFDSSRRTFHVDNINAVDVEKSKL